MATQPSNPFAFPSPDDGRPADGYGMDLRDWFATSAPEPTVERMATERGIDRSRNPHNEGHRPPLRSDDEIRACLAYRYADAMLAERAKIVTPA